MIIGNFERAIKWRDESLVNPFNLERAANAALGTQTAAPPRFCRLAQRFGNRHDWQADNHGAHGIDACGILLTRGMVPRGVANFGSEP
jgi:hypothetical protein